MSRNTISNIGLALVVLFILVVSYITGLEQNELLAIWTGVIFAALSYGTLLKWLISKYNTE